MRSDPNLLSLNIDGFDLVLISHLCVKFSATHFFLMQSHIQEYLKSDIFVLPSSSEPFGYSVLEAMACGLPVICSDSAGVQWYIEEGVNGYVFKSNDLNDLTDKIKLVISDKAKMKKMGEESRRLVEEKYSPEVFYKKFMEILSSKK